MSQIAPLTINEVVIPGVIGSYAVDDIYHTGESKFQRIQVVNLKAFGRTLMLDEKMQSASSDEFIYHESLVYPALLTHPNPKKVLILGGGEGGTARESLRFKSVERVVMVDIDEVVVETSKQFLTSYHKGAWENSRLEVVIGCAKAYLESTTEKWDVIVADLADPVVGNPCYMLYTIEFYEMLKTKLSSDGILVTQAGPCGFYNIHEVCIPVKNTLTKVFKNSVMYHSLCPSFFDHYAFVMVSDSCDVNKLLNTNVDQLIEERVDATHESDAEPTDVGTKVAQHIDDATMKAAFVLPKWVRRAFEKHADVIISNDSPTFLS